LKTAGILSLSLSQTPAVVNLYDSVTAHCLHLFYCPGVADPRSNQKEFGLGRRVERLLGDRFLVNDCLGPRNPWVDF
jgi:hypothetical protein